MGTDEVEMETQMLRIRARCRDDAGCLIYHGNRTAKGLPVANGRSLRRVVWEAVNGPLLPSQLITVTCDQVSCLEPEHLALTTKSEAGVKANKALHVRVRRAGTLSATKRKLSVLTLEDVRNIRSSSDLCRTLAEEHGVTASMISKIRLGLAWCEQANPFSGLGARA